MNIPFQTISFKNTPVCLVDYRKHLRLTLGFKLIFDMFTKMILAKVNENIDL